MYKLKIYQKAKDSLDYLKKQNDNFLKEILLSLDDINEKGLNSSNIKNIGDMVFRKRVGRWRILFTVDKIFHIWIIDIEKNTKKDYKKWKQYIIEKIKSQK